MSRDSMLTTFTMSYIFRGPTCTIDTIESADACAGRGTLII